MSKRNPNKSLFGVIVTILASLSCVSTPGEAPPWVAADQESQDLLRTACDGTPFLVVTSSITKQETNQYGTQLCEYTLTIKNTGSENSIGIYIYQHDKDGYAGTEKSHWMGNVLVSPDEEGNWLGNVYLYDDKDANGPVMSVPEKIAGVFNISECNEEKQDTNFLESIAIPIEAVCPIE